MKKLLLLGGLKYLLPVIERAKAMDLYVITCDYLPNNIAHKYSDEYHNVNITDKKAVLNLAKNLNIDGIMSYAVDPGVSTAAYVCESLGLNNVGPYESVKVLQNKALFRNYLSDNNFNVPYTQSYTTIKEAIKGVHKFNFPCIVKPVDSAGSKGVSKINHNKDIESAILNAFKESRSNCIIIEEFLTSEGCPSDSDCYVYNGKLEFATYSNQYFDKSSPNPFTPSAFLWPSSLSISDQLFLTKELQRLFDLLKMNTALYNVEVRKSNGRLYLMEVSPRGGGNRISEMLEYSTGIDFISCAINGAIGEKMEILKPLSHNKIIGQVILHSNSTGKFDEIVIDKSIENKVRELDLWVKKGDPVNSFKGANDSIGTLVLESDDKVYLEAIIKNIDAYINIKLYD